MRAFAGKGMHRDRRAQGIGFATARSFLDDGATVAVCATFGARASTQP